MIRELTCINCPMGCQLEVTIEEGQVISVTGNTCPRGKIYGESECIHPVRMVTSSVPVKGGGRVSVKTAHAIPKEKIADVMIDIHGYQGQKPIRVGQVLIEDLAHTGVALVATKDSI